MKKCASSRQSSEAAGWTGSATASCSGSRRKKRKMSKGEEGVRASAAPLLPLLIALMTHEYRVSIVVLSISKIVEPNEEQKEMTSGFQ